MAQLCFNMFNRSAFLVPDPDLPGLLSAAAGAGFKLFAPDIYSVDAWTAAGHSLGELACQVEDRGLSCWEISGLDLAAGDPIGDAHHLAEVAHALGIGWVLTNQMAPVEGAADLFVKACDVLADAGVRAAVEYLPFTPVNSIAAARRLVDAAGLEHSGILFDTWHHFRGPDTDAELEAAPLELVAYLQFDDALPVISDDIMDETLNRRTFPGEGEFDLDGYCGIMRAKGFDGVVSIEILNGEWRQGDQAEFARRAYQSTARFWS